MKKALLLFSITLLLFSCKQKPVENRNDKASIPESFGFKAMNLKTITTFINPNAHTTSTLYGNQAAYEAMKNNSAKIDEEKKLVLVSWKLEEDPKWFGAMVPGDLLSIEELNLPDMHAARTSIQYEKFNGKSLKKEETTNETEKQQRINLILSLKPAVTP